MTRRVSVRVPATSANLGPGFDCLGVALDLYNTVTISSSDSFRIDVTGEGTDELPRHEGNTAYKAVQTLAKTAGLDVPPLFLLLDNQIPLARGLGSSAAAIVGALVAADRFLDAGLTVECLLDLATQIEGHPDNVAPALLGGCTVVVRDGERLVHASLPLPAGLLAVLFVPDFKLPTAMARRVLPGWVEMADAVFNVGRAALLAASLATGAVDLLKTATQDALHQPYRKSLFPGMGRLFGAALDAGALGVFLSGAGPTILALAQGDAEPVALAMAEAAGTEGISGSTRTMSLGTEGARLVEIEQE